MDRRERILEHVDLRRPGLEIGALHHPVVRREDAPVRYVDHADTSALHAKYDAEAEVGAIVDVDVVWGDAALADALAAAGGEQQVDWVVASHVIEHVPDVVGWLDELADVIRPGGTLALAVPDRRYCFDAPRRDTSTAELVGAWLERRRRPPLAMVYDFHARSTAVDTPAVWAGTADYADHPPDHRLGLGMAQRAAAGEYVDVHCSVFTPESFLAVLRDLAHLDALRFEVAAFHPTEPGALEFHVSLRRLPDDLADGGAEARRDRILATIPEQAAAPQRDDGVRAVALSPKEVRLIERKRRAAEAARRLRGRLPFGGPPRRAE